MDSAKDILNGWQNFIGKSEVSEELAIKRAKKCSTCPYKSFSKTLKAFVKDDIIEVEGYVCMKCEGIIKCPLSAKVRSKDVKCPNNEW